MPGLIEFLTKHQENYLGSSFNIMDTYSQVIPSLQDRASEVFDSVLIKLKI